MKIAMLGSGFIARFYAETLHSQRRRDHVVMVYSRNEENAKRFENTSLSSHKRLILGRPHL